MDDLEIYLASPPDLAARAARLAPVSAQGYRVGRDLRLYRAPYDLSSATFLDVDATAFQGYGPHEALVAALTRECRRMGCRGLSLDLPRPNERLFAFCGTLDAAAHRQGLRLFLPERYARAAPHASLLIPAQNTSGVYGDRLSRLISLYGPERIALEAERVFTDFPLPCRNRPGAILTRRCIPPLSRGQIHYSPALCANYAAYKREGRLHLLLWDDLCSLRDKLRAARAAGIREIFFYYPHVADILPDLWT